MAGRVKFIAQISDGGDELAGIIDTGVVPAGWPSPASDYESDPVNIQDFLIKNPPATIVVEVSGDSMTGASIYSGDKLIVDSSIDPKDQDIVIACLDGEFTVKRLRLWKNRAFLVPENKDFKKIEVTERDDFYIWGVVTWTLRKMYNLL